MKNPVLAMSMSFVLGFLGLGCEPSVCEVSGECTNGDVCLGNQCVASCDDFGECGNAHEGCIACAQETVCESQMQRCEQNLDCQQLLQAIEACSKTGPDKIDEPCYNAAVELHQEGYDIYYDIATCVWCGPCTSSCAEYSQTFCP